MTKTELLELLSGLDDNAEICVVNDEQEVCYDIMEVRVCEDNASEFKGKYADLVVNL